jgi:hypothetical protein
MCWTPWSESITFSLHDRKPKVGFPEPYYPVEKVAMHQQIEGHVVLQVLAGADRQNDEPEYSSSH